METTIPKCGNKISFHCENRAERRGKGETTEFEFLTNKTVRKNPIKLLGSFSNDAICRVDFFAIVLSCSHATTLASFAKTTLVEASLN